MLMPTVPLRTEQVLYFRMPNQELPAYLVILWHSPPPSPACKERATPA